MIPAEWKRVCTEFSKKKSPPIFFKLIFSFFFSIELKLNNINTSNALVESLQSENDDDDDELSIIDDAELNISTDQTHGTPQTQMQNDGNSSDENETAVPLLVEQLSRIIINYVTSNPSLTVEK